MANKVDWTKPIQTIEGGKAALVHTLNHGDRRRLVVFEEIPGKETCLAYYENGTIHNGCVDFNRIDIINVPPKKIKVWVNVYKSGTSVYYSTREVAEDNAYKYCLDIIEIEVPENVDVFTR